MLVLKTQKPRKCRYSQLMLNYQKPTSPTSSQPTPKKTTKLDPNSEVYAKTIADAVKTLQFLDSRVHNESPRDESRDPRQQVHIYLPQGDNWDGNHISDFGPNN